mmetsp:Transcript_22813/g.73414  ORF Transcript_22813/g.73414 Transcript_22813/m.73414 type:complete len:556 (+) Transcript_22813:102-1769(+)|eukprot:CAMPEP_0196770920 /NCGR_PEP_ID=MMETSP1104-20130614/1408_1 /TAXON_ID=33652 /ORGANISM="Cafeteria sp., Strain Caron Lab Isolate" /LENGTH=555 /DNA_ID=CAMNT_0042141035 /DNA_START=44 /DNA_END=1711 /DNA_ORIENTATION=-
MEETKDKAQTAAPESSKDALDLPPATAGSSRLLSRRGGHQPIVFAPTRAELDSKSFEAFFASIEARASIAGCCVVRAPSGFVATKRFLSDPCFADSVMVKPMYQHVFLPRNRAITQRAYEVFLAECDSMSMRDYLRVAEQYRAMWGPGPDPSSLLATAPDSSDPGAADHAAAKLANTFWSQIDEHATLASRAWRSTGRRPHTRTGSQQEEDAVESCSEFSVYAADLPVRSVFPAVHPWSLERLDSLLQRVLSAKGVSIPGVTTSMLYAGSPRSLFAAHKEDCDLFSINYLSEGAPKLWYCVPPSHAARVERVAAAAFPAWKTDCPDFMRHKTTMLSPAFLEQHGIPYTFIVQRPGDFVITYPGCFHFGFNSGVNVAEATNFATPSWIPVGRRARYCKCRSDSVRIDMRLFDELAPPTAAPSSLPATTHDGAVSAISSASMHQQSARSGRKRPRKRRRQAAQVPSLRGLEPGSASLGGDSAVDPSLLRARDRVGVLSSAIAGCDSALQGQVMEGTVVRSSRDGKSLQIQLMCPLSGIKLPARWISMEELRGRLYRL